MLLVFAQVIGWRALSMAFPGDAGHRAGAPMPSTGVLLGAWGWNAPPLRVALDEQGLWLLPRAPFGVAFRDVRLPWTAILSVGTRHFVLFDVVEVRYGPGPKAVIAFVTGPAATAVAEQATARGALPLPAQE